MAEVGARTGADDPRPRGAGYRESPERLAFPGWRSREIHRALTEEPISEAAWRALERVGRTMGGREGARPEDDPLTRSLNARARAEGNEEGRRSGRAEAAPGAHRARGIDPGADFAADEEPFAELGLDTLMAASLACTDEADFRQRTERRARDLGLAGGAPSAPGPVVGAGAAESGAGRIRAPGQLPRTGGREAEPLGSTWPSLGRIALRPPERSVTSSAMRSETQDLPVPQA